MNEVVNEAPKKVVDLRLGVNGIANMLKQNYKMSEDSIVLFFMAVIADDEKFRADAILRDVVYHRGLKPLREEIRKEFEADEPKINQKDIERFIGASNAELKSYF